MRQSPVHSLRGDEEITEVISHSNAHLWGVPTTVFRFFSAYGPWGRPDMALFKFVETDSISTVAPYRIVKIGGGKPISLLRFIKTGSTSGRGSAGWGTRIRT